MKSMYSLLSILIILAVLSGASSTQANRCDQGDLPEVIVSNCEIPPCIFYINDNSSMTIRFRAPRYLEKIAPKAVATTFGVDFVYPLGQDDACDGITNTPCPLAEGEYVEYTYAMFILPIFPPVEHEMRNLMCEDGDITLDVYVLYGRLTNTVWMKGTSGLDRRIGVSLEPPIAYFSTLIQLIFIKVP